ncbi:hypothetical protein ACOJIV_24585, partial [Haloarcula sp. AONF1]
CSRMGLSGIGVSVVVTALPVASFTAPSADEEAGLSLKVLRMHRLRIHVVRELSGSDLQLHQPDV